MPIPTKLTRFILPRENFIKEVVVQIKNRFSFDSDIFAFSELLDPVQGQDLNPPSLAPFLAKYSLPSWSKSLIDREWREQSSVRQPNGEDASLLSVTDYWKLIFAQKYSNGKPKFGNLKLVVEYLYALPFSNVKAERLFSTLKDVKTDKPNCLSTVTISSTLQTKLGMSRLKVTPQSLVVNGSMRQLLKGVVASATANEASAAILKSASLARARLAPERANNTVDDQD